MRGAVEGLLSSAAMSAVECHAVLSTSLPMPGGGGACRVTASAVKAAFSLSRSRGGGDVLGDGSVLVVII
jgi:hypothetical protein